MTITTECRLGRAATRRRPRCPVLLAFVYTAVVFGALGWVCVAIIAVFTPTGLPLPLIEGISLRRDTFGIISFGVSAVAHFFREVQWNHGGDGRISLHVVARGALTTVFMYAGATAIYLMANSITHPHTMSLPLTHLLDWPTEKTVLTCAVVAVLTSFFLLRMTAYSAKNHDGDDMSLVAGRGVRSAARSYPGFASSRSRGGW